MYVITYGPMHVRIYMSEPTYVRTVQEEMKLTKTNVLCCYVQGYYEPNYGHNLYLRT